MVRLLLSFDFGSGFDGDAFDRDDALVQLIDCGLDQSVKLRLIDLDAVLLEPGDNIGLLLLSAAAAVENLLGSRDGDLDPRIDFLLLLGRGLALDVGDQDAGDDGGEQETGGLDYGGDVLHDKSSFVYPFPVVVVSEQDAMVDVSTVASVFAV